MLSVFSAFSVLASLRLNKNFVLFLCFLLVSFFQFHCLLPGGFIVAYQPFIHFHFYLFHPYSMFSTVPSVCNLYVPLAKNPWRQ